MIEPINPENHDVQGLAKVVFVVNPSGGRTMSVPHYQGFASIALVEAIHQTFERDVEFAGRCEERKIQSARFYACSPDPGHDYRYDAAGERIPYVGPPRRESDPGTEVDRFARLIVDGEYRRRANPQGAARP